MLNTLNSWATANIAFLFIGMIVAIVLLLGILLLQITRIGSLKKAHKALMTGMDDKNLEELLEAYLDKIKFAEGKVSELSSTCKGLEQYAQKSLQNVALLRFNAFENMGSDLSFAIALLDLNGDGVVLSSINSREESRVYAKPVLAGNSTHHLSQEEVETIAKAMLRGAPIK